MRKVSTLSGIISIIIIAAAVGAFVYSEFENKDISSVDVSMPNPAKKEAGDNSEIKTECPVCEDKSDSEIKLPVIRFIPAIFSDKEKKDLLEKVLSPYMDYEKDSGVGNRIISILVNKYSDHELSQQTDPKYAYGIDVVYEEGYVGWVERKIGEPIDWWVPDCMGNCEFSDEYQDSYPEVVEKYNNIQNQE